MAKLLNILGVMNEQSSPQVHSRSSNGTPMFEKRCPECGAITLVDKRRLLKPCHPCAMRARRTHGLSAGGGLHPIYRLFNGIKARCYSPSATNYAYYGGRGIAVFQEWLDSPALFVAWAEAQGWRPDLEIDRIDVDGDYCPANCRFITHRENSQRTRRISTTPGKVLLVRAALDSGATVADAAKQAGVTYMVAWHIRNSPGVWANV